MAKAVKKRTAKKSKKAAAAASPFNIYWEKKNYLLLGIGFAILILGYIFMSMGNWDSFPSLVISPILLVIAYLLIFPAAILYKKKKVVQENPAEKSEPEQ